MSSFVVKFCYNQAIKKVQITKDQLNWENVCSILMKSFYLAEKDKIQLKYKDLEDDEITVSSDDDLIEAFNLYFMKNLVKFFVYYSGVFSQGGQNTGYSKIERPISLSISPEAARKNSNSPKVKNVEINEKVQTNEKILNTENTEASKPQEKTVNVHIDSNELQNIFSEVFSNTDIIKKIQHKLKGYISKEHSSSDDIVEYSIDTDYQAIANYMIASLSDIMNKKINPDEPKTNTQNHEEEKINLNSQSSAESSKEKKNLLDVSLRESIYESSNQNSFYTSREKDPRISSLNSSIECRDLGSKLGVKLVLKYEGGKAKFVSIPVHEYSIIEPKESSAQNNVSKKLNDKRTEYEKVELKEEKVDESLYDVVLSLKKKASTEKKASEFSKQLLKPNIHDLDEDLPAPYDKKLVQKYEQGMKDSIYEKID